MANLGGSGIKQGRPPNMPPFFDGRAFGRWKIEMKAFLEANDYDAWMVIENGDHIIAKLKDIWNENDKKLVQINARALNYLFCSIEASKLTIDSTFGYSAKTIWDRLEYDHGHKFY